MSLLRQMESVVEIAQPDGWHLVSTEPTRRMGHERRDEIAGNTRKTTRAVGVHVLRGRELGI